MLGVYLRDYLQFLKRNLRCDLDCRGKFRCENGNCPNRGFLKSVVGEPKRGVFVALNASPRIWSSDARKTTNVTFRAGTAGFRIHARGLPCSSTSGIDLNSGLVPVQLWVVLDRAIFASPFAFLRNRAQTRQTLVSTNFKLVVNFNAPLVE